MDQSIYAGWHPRYSCTGGSCISEMKAFALAYNVHINLRDLRVLLLLGQIDTRSMSVSNQRCIYSGSESEFIAREQ